MPKPKQTLGFYYSPAWRATRRAALIRAGYRCAVCGISIAGPKQARVDHIKPLRTHPHLALSLANLRALCPQHDNQSHREKGRRSGANGREECFMIAGCDAMGKPLDPQHHWANRG
jgi:5-methylcytosine-specific restriction protein A